MSLWKRSAAVGVCLVVGVGCQGGGGVLGASTGEDAGAHCASGGTRLDFGDDTNANGTLNPSEVDATKTQYSCNGTNGTNGTVAATAAEPAGSNCANGGARLTFGVDQNANGTLDAFEVQPLLTQYVCEPTTFNGSLSSSNSIKVTTGAPAMAGACIDNTNPLIEASNNTSSPFTVYPDGTMVAEGFVHDWGNTHPCPIPVQGAGTRFMWVPTRGSLRFGRVPTAQTNWDEVNMDDFTFAGGNQVIANGYGAFAYGDQVNVTSTVGVGFGSGVTVSGTAGFSSGASNVCSGFACTAIGYTVRAGGQGSVALGYRTTANNDYTVALGYRASNNTHTGTFVWGDESTTDSVRNQQDNEFRLRAAGGIKLRTSAAANSAPGVGGNTGCDLPAGSGTFTCSSSRDLKENFEEVNGEEILHRLSAMPVTRWNWKSDAEKGWHMGPVAQDFHQAYGLGTEQAAIGVQDLAGVALAAAKALEVRTKQLDAKTRELGHLEGELADLRRQMVELRGLLNRPPHPAAHPSTAAR